MRCSGMLASRILLNNLECFDEEGRRTVAFAQEEARLLGHNYLGTEHLLLGLLDSCDRRTGRILAEAGITRHRVRQATVSIIGHGQRAPVGRVLLTPRARNILESAVDFRSTKDPVQQVSLTDILMGIVNEPTSIALRVIDQLGVDAVHMRACAALVVGDGDTWQASPVASLEQ